jgi:hypothetical protein
MAFLKAVSQRLRDLSHEKNGAALATAPKGRNVHEETRLNGYTAEGQPRAPICFGQVTAMAYHRLVHPRPDRPKREAARSRSPLSQRRASVGALASDRRR